MGNLAIKGHPTRGKEVIEILEMLGGINTYKINYTEKNLLYCLREGDNVIIATYPNTSITKIFTIEEFLEKYPYKVGDKVYNIVHNETQTITDSAWDFQEDEVGYQTNNNEYVYVNYLQPCKEETMENKPNLLQRLKEYFDNTPRDVLEKEWNELSYLNEIGPTIDQYLECVKKYRLPKYPNTYEECCKMLGYSGNYNMILTTDVDNKLFNALYRLKVCRDAYWKIAGGWKPDFMYCDLYCIGYDGNVITWKMQGGHRLLAFPTAEIRDVFYENFKELIEECKELL